MVVLLLKFYAQSECIQFRHPEILLRHSHELGLPCVSPDFPESKIPRFTSLSTWSWWRIVTETRVQVAGQRLRFHDPVTHVLYGAISFLCVMSSRFMDTKQDILQATHTTQQCVYYAGAFGDVKRGFGLETDLLPTTRQRNPKIEHLMEIKDPLTTPSPPPPFNFIQARL